MDNVPSSIPHIKAGRLHALAVMSDKRLPTLPDVPTFAEVGLKEANNMAWYGLIGPAGLAPEVVQKVNAAANAALKDTEVLKRFAENGSIAAGGTPQQFAQTAARELALRREIVRKQKITLD
jgi:tripartite-type tricarboxylate transporter receptor subunit TctC